MTELALPGVAVLAPEEVPEWVGQEGGEWVAPEQVQDQVENAFALNAVTSFAMKPESPVPTSSAQNAGRR